MVFHFDDGHKAFCASSIRHLLIHLTAHDGRRVINCQLQTVNYKQFHHLIPTLYAMLNLTPTLHHEETFLTAE